MQLNKTQWKQEDLPVFLTYLEQFRRPEKMAWSKMMLNSQLDVLAIPTKTIVQIAKAILEGNYLSFLDLQLFVSYETIALYGMLLTKITDFSRMNHYLTIYRDVMENWAHVDLLSFSMNEINTPLFLNLSEECLQSHRPFDRRLGLLILFQLIKQETYVNRALQALSNLEKETEYYVIMMGGWLLSECIIRHETLTLAYLKSTFMNPKIVNKGIQKCRESLRLTPEKKEALLVYKRSVKKR